jgi:zinc protease
MPMNRLLLVVLGALGACTSSSGAAAAPTLPKAPAVAATQPASAPASAPVGKLPAPVRTVEGVTEYQLDNGLRVLLVPDESQPKVTVAIVYHVGSRYEGYGETGMAHLLEHMQFKGTPKHKDISAEQREHGAAANATTSYDRTEYHETMTATDANLAWALDLEADRMVSSNIAAEDLAKEFSVVRNEFERGENSPDTILLERVLSTMYLWHNYGKAIIGSRSDIERVPASALKAFYKKYYQPDNAVLVVSGKLDKDKTLGLIAADFGAIPRPQRKLEATYTVEPVQDGERSVTLRRTGDVQVVALAYHVVAGSDERAEGVSALGYLLTDQPTGRLYKALVTTGLAAAVDVDDTPMAEPGFLYIEADVPKGKSVDVVKDKMIQIVEGLGKQPPTDEEIARWKAHEAKQFELFLASSEGTARGLVEAEAVGDWRLLYLGRDRAEKLGAKAAADVAVAFFKPANRTVGLFLPTATPERSPLPGEPDVAALVKDYQGRAAVAEGEAFEATLDNIGKRTETTTLANGMKLALLAKKTRGQTVHAVLALHYGTEKDLTGHEAAAELMPLLFMRGSRRHSFEQIKSELDRLKAQVQIGGEIGVVSVAVTVQRPNLVPTLALVTELLEEPVFPKDQLDVLKKEEITGLEAQLQDPEAQGENAFRRHLRHYPKTDIRYVPTTQEQIARVQAATLDDIKRIYKLVGASFAEGGLVGDFDGAEVKAALAKGLGTWKSPRPFARIATPYQAAAPADEKIDTPDKENGFLLAGMNVELRDDDPDFAPLYLALNALGGGEAARLFLRLREKEGWSYGTFAGLSVDAQDRRGAVYLYALVAPQNAAKAMAAMVEELERLVRGGVPADELAKVKSEYEGQFEQHLANDQAMAGMLGRDLYLGRTIDFHKQQHDRILAVTSDAISAVLKKPYVKPAELVKIEAADAKKAAAK